MPFNWGGVDLPVFVEQVEKFMVEPFSRDISILGGVQDSAAQVSSNLV